MEKEVISIMKQLVDGIEHCHDKGIFHGNITCSCILINPKSNQIKISDFGSTYSNSCIKNISNYAIKSVYYSPPELFKNNGEKKNFNNFAAIDIWAIGVVIYMLYFGEFPFGKTEQQTLFNIKEKIVSINYIKPRKGNFIGDILRKIFKSDPQKRITPSQVIIILFSFFNNNKNLDQ